MTISVPFGLGLKAFPALSPPVGIHIEDQSFSDVSDPRLSSPFKSVRKTPG
jgi:hypothetical protein